MSRAEKRRAEKAEHKAKTATYNLTRAQLDAYINEGIKNELDKAREEGWNDGINKAMILFLALPMKVLMDHYWVKSYEKRIPGFITYVLDYYDKWDNGELDLDKIREDLWIYAGVKLEEVEE